MGSRLISLGNEGILEVKEMKSEGSFKGIK